MSDVLSRSVDGGLVRLLTGLGLDYEALIARSEIGGAVSTLKRLLEEGRSGSDSLDKVLADKLEQHAGLFELWQLIRLKLSRQAVEFWPLPLPGTEQAFLVAERGEGDGPGEADGGERSWRITVHLQLPGLGPLQIDFLRESSGLLLRFQCASPDQVRLLAENEEELKRSVAALRGAPPWCAGDINTDSDTDTDTDTDSERQSACFAT